MNIGSLYKVKWGFWSLFPSKETGLPIVGDVVEAVLGSSGAADAAANVAYWSKQLNCEITYFPLDSIVVFLEEDGPYKKVLTSDGKIGWTCFVEDYIDCFEEVKTES